MRRLALTALVAVPPLLLAGAGLVHPMHLTASSARTWRDLHVVLLPVFPLLGLAPWLLVRHENVWLGRLAALLGYVYAAFYSALDVLAGIGAGALEQAHTAGTLVLFHDADELARYGVWAYLLAGLLTAAVLIARSGVLALPGAVLVVLGGVSFLDSHIFWPRGVLTMLALAAGWTWLVALGMEDSRTVITPGITGE